MNKITPAPRADDFPALLSLVKLAKSRQHGSITPNQLVRLERQYLRVQPLTSPLFGWYYRHRTEVRRVLAEHGVTTRPTKTKRPHRYKLVQTGIAGLAEIEGKIARAQARRRTNAEQAAVT